MSSEQQSKLQATKERVEGCCTAATRGMETPMMWLSLFDPGCLLLCVCLGDVFCAFHLYSFTQDIKVRPQRYSTQEARKTNKTCTQSPSQ
eukprot:545734-Amphidinium_carterae.1